MTDTELSPPAVRRRGAGALAFATALLVALAGCSGSPGAATAGPATTSAAASPSGPPADPFAGTPAASWEPAADALRAPTLTAPPGVPDPTLASRLGYAASLLRVVTIDQRVNAGDVQPVLDVLGPDLADDVRSKVLALDRHDGHWALLAPRFDRLSTRIDGGVRASGTWSATTSTDEDGTPTLDITWNGGVAYPVVSPDGQGRALVATRRTLTMSWAVETDQATPWSVDVSSRMPDNVDFCRTVDRNAYVADFTAAPPTTSDLYEAGDPPVGGDSAGFNARVAGCTAGPSPAGSSPVGSSRPV